MSRHARFQKRDWPRLGRMNDMFDQHAGQKNALFAEVFQLGYPQFVGDKAVPTACVATTKDKRLLYMWNRGFFDTLSLESMGYVACHEALHVILNHLKRKQSRDAEKWNIACDLAVNTILDTSYFQPGPELSTRVKPETFGWKYSDIRGMTAEQIYDRLPKNWASAAYTSIDDHGGWDELDPEVIERVRESVARAVSQKGGGTSWGSGSSGEIEVLHKMFSRPFPWDRLLRHRLASVRKPFDGENWARPHRKLYGSYPNIILPGPHEASQDTSRILLSIDTSGSMSNKDIEKCVSIVMSLDREAYEVTITWFDDGVYHTESLSKAMGRGGTNFGSVERVANGSQVIGGSKQKLEHYPDVVIMLTDGYADRPTVQYPNRWIWIITKGGSKSAVNGIGTVWQMTD